jgi:predicted metal-dependent HD superfamily phosphohydrolase
MDVVHGFQSKLRQNVKPATMAWIPPPLDPAPYGAGLAQRVAHYLKQGHGLGYGHRDYCGMGLELLDSRFCYGELNDGRMDPPEEWRKDGPNRAFDSAEAFVAWLAEQSDVTLARLEAADEFYHRNQTITRERLEEFAGVRDDAPLVSRPRWDALARDIGGNDELSLRYFLLFSCYGEEHRRYHNLRHLNECLAEFDATRSFAKGPAVLEMALWFHDAVYDPKVSDNEERSAEWAARLLEEGGVKKQEIHAVTALILVTKNHLPDKTPDAGLMCDIDLAILGQPPQRFQEYEAAIRAEYAHVPDAAFNAGRAAILQRFLDRPHIYQTEPFRSRYEEAARRNLEESVRSLFSTKPKRRRWFG